MAKTKSEKAAIIDKVEKALKEGASSVFVHFTKVTVAEESAMRRALKKDGVAYFVAKKTLIRRALDKLRHKSTELPLEGEVAIASGGGEDATAPARLIHEFGKKLTDPFDKLRAGKLTILGGIFEGKLVGQAAMQEIATIPPMQTLRAMFAQIVNSPRQRFAMVLSKVAEKKS
ncbi:50S ribosomal protein L10 [Candidatus Kaiserbacteria bacterium RIFCSPHIGHO2_01_FULL_55_17]|uniref:Large ribosomal subunit protein uL10 n=1 Tax=Candidatus Kaiserbacteria bacterium RIFCSPHIGHO2_01_FULL_55_17 TaxID=1798484 RepID=A0A1F6DA33_9BACT|nr:MAG: 50S ribosomal protein L10 [Candidatus Kaiserbacteria bacterium RIFCSPHIGHO2_01_FULL_55_17]